MYKGVIFDFNGTLFEDTYIQADAWKEVIRRHFGREMDISEFFSSFHGRGNVDILTYVNSLDPDKQFDISITDEKEEVYRQICREQPERAVFLPGVEQTFDALKAGGIPIAIATACEIKNLDFIYEVFRLERWFGRGHIAYDDRTYPLKPAPDVYFKAAEMLSLPPSECVVCEDSRSGLIAAQSAGAGRIIARRSVQRNDDLYKDLGIYAFIDDFRDFYPKYLL